MKKFHPFSLFILFFILFISFPKFIVQGFPNVAAQVGSNVGIYFDQGCTNPVTEIIWDKLTPGAHVDEIIYIRNEMNNKITLYLDSDSWVPTETGQYVHISWDYAGQILDVGQVMRVTLTLSADLNIHNITAFNFNIIIRGIETSTTTTETTTTVIPNFDVNSFTCHLISNGYGCQLNYINNLDQDAYILFLYSDSKGKILPGAVLMKAYKGSSVIESVFLCTLNKGTYHIDWIAYLASDTMLKTPIKWSTPSETQVVNC